MASTSLALLEPDSASLSPLPDVLHQGLTGVASLACLSFAASIFTLSYLTYKLVRWHLKSWRAARHARDRAAMPAVDLNLGLEEQHFGGNSHQRDASTFKRKSPNQFLILIYNLLLADMHQSAAFMINVAWVSNDAIQVGTPTCWAQGWFISTGDLASSCFILLIAIHTYMTVVWQQKPPQWALYVAIGTAWLFNYAMAIVGIASTKNGIEYGGYYVRAAAWCWINVKYEKLRLVTHYLFIFIALAVTSLLYTLIFFSLKKREVQASARDALPRGKPSPSIDYRRPSVTDGDTNPTPANAAAAKVVAHSGGRHPAFLLYPIIYVICTAPLALGRIATMAGATVPLSYFCVAGALISSNGWLDVLLWGCTRGELLFTADVDAEDVGLGTFAFMRTPPGRKFGNMVWVEGGGQRDMDSGPARNSRQISGGSGLGGWLQERMGWRRLGRGSVVSTRGGKGKLASQARSISQESLHGADGRNDMAIQMDLVTTVVVEVDPDKRQASDSRSRYWHQSETSLSVNSAEKDIGSGRA